MKFSFNLHALIQFVLFVATNAAAQKMVPDEFVQWIVLIASGAQMAFGLEGHTRDKDGNRLGASPKE